MKFFRLACAWALLATTANRSIESFETIRREQPEANRTFLDHVEFLSSHLQREYDLVAIPGSGTFQGTVLLENDEVQFRFFPGCPRDPYVEVHVAFADPDVLGPERYFELRRYVEYADGWNFFPIRYPEGKATKILNRNKDYMFIESPFLVQELVSFLTALGASILEVDKEKMQAFMTWQSIRNREYTESVSRKPR